MKLSIDDSEFKPCFTWDLHLCIECEAAGIAIGDDDTPEIKSVTGFYFTWVIVAAPHPDAANDFINESTQFPRPQHAGPAIATS